MIRRRIITLSILVGFFSGVPLSGGISSTLHDFPHIGDGRGVFTIFLILNQNEEAVTVTISFFADDGSPLSLTFNDQTGTSIQIVVPARGTVKLTSSGAGAEPTTGSARLQATGDVGAQVLFEIRVEGNLVTQAAVESSPGIREADVFVEQAPGTGTAIALANVTGSQIAMRLTLRNAAGEVLTEKEITLEGREHIAMFMDQLFPGTEITNATVHISSSGFVSVVTLQQTGLVLGTLSIVEVRNDKGKVTRCDHAILTHPVE